MTRYKVSCYRPTVDGYVPATFVATCQGAEWVTVTVGTSRSYYDMTIERRLEPEKSRFCD